MSGFKLLGGSSTLPTIVSDMNTNILELKNQDVTKIFKDDTGTPVVILDKNGLRTTLPGSGVDVTTATNAQLTGNSNQDIFKIVKKLVGVASAYTTVATAAAGQVAVDIQSVGIPHGQTYAPAVDGYLTSGTNFYKLPITTYALAADNVRYAQVTTRIYSTATNIVLEIQTFLSALTSASPINANVSATNLTVYVLQETATPS